MKTSWWFWFLIGALGSTAASSRFAPSVRYASTFFIFLACAIQTNALLAPGRSRQRRIETMIKSWGFLSFPSFQPCCRCQQETRALFTKATERVGEQTFDRIDQRIAHVCLRCEAVADFPDASGRDVVLVMDWDPPKTPDEVKDFFEQGYKDRAYRRRARAG